MSTPEYDSAVNYFNNVGAHTIDQIRYTYDADENMLVQQHSEAIEQRNSAAGKAFWCAVAGVCAVDSTYEAMQKDNWSQYGPDWSLAFIALFGAGLAVHIRNRRNIIKAVDRNVGSDKSSANNIVM